MKQLLLNPFQNSCLLFANGTLTCFLNILLTSFPYQNSCKFPKLTQSNNHFKYKHLRKRRHFISQNCPNFPPSFFFADNISEITNEQSDPFVPMANIFLTVSYLCKHNFERQFPEKARKMSPFMKTVSKVPFYHFLYTVLFDFCMAFVINMHI